MAAKQREEHMGQPTPISRHDMIRHAFSTLIDKGGVYHDCQNTFMVRFMRGTYEPT